ncbi:hypothetical protein ACFXPX_32800 [Kitasatospora sp. NPDC059146]|uniref:hypothetical protein n=1 Tax=unclassified Kitasatospora TaxID=2633591 RepID=UPI0036CBD00B
MTSNLPVDHTKASPVTPIRAGAQGIQRDLGADLRRATAVLRGMPNQAESDITVAASAAIVVTGRTPADALQTAVDWRRNATHATTCTPPSPAPTWLPWPPSGPSAAKSTPCTIVDPDRWCHAGWNVRQLGRPGK